MTSRLVALSLVLAAAAGQALEGTLEGTASKIERLTYIPGAKSSYDLQICVNVTLADESASVILWDGSHETNVPGTQEKDPKCFGFTGVKFPVDGSNVRYDIHLYHGDDFKGPMAKVNYTFNLVNDVSSFKCGANSYARVVYNNAHKPRDDETCINGDKTCYVSGGIDVSGGNGSLCMPTTNNRDQQDLVYCQPGTTNNISTTDLFTPSLSYGGFMSFSLDTKNTQKATETILSYSDSVHIAATPAGGKVAIPGFTNTVFEYTVCAVVPTPTGGASSVQIASIQDLKIQNVGTPGDHDECDIAFVNKHPSDYEAYSVESDPKSTVTCVADKPCFMDIHPCTNASISLAYQDGTNLIHVPDLTKW